MLNGTQKIPPTVSINYFLLTSIIWVITPGPLHVENVHLSVSDWPESEPDPANRNDRINYHLNTQTGIQHFYIRDIGEIEISWFLDSSKNQIFFIQLQTPFLNDACKLNFLPNSPNCISTKGKKIKREDAI